MKHTIWRVDYNTIDRVVGEFCEFDKTVTMDNCPGFVGFETTKFLESAKFEFAFEFFEPTVDHFKGR